mgnify:FL=1
MHRCPFPFRDGLYGVTRQGQRVCLGAVFYGGHNDFPGFFLAIPSHLEIVVAQADCALEITGCVFNCGGKYCFREGSPLDIGKAIVALLVKVRAVVGCALEIDTLFRSILTSLRTNRI